MDSGRPRAYKRHVSDDPNLIRVEGTDRVFRRGRILIVLLIPIAMALVAVSSINVALPSISSGLGATDTDLQWVLSGYALTFGISLVPAGRAGDVLGRGAFFVIGLLLFSVASLACSLAPTPEFLNVARFAQGIGAGLYNPQTMGMIQQYWRGMERARAFALFGMVVAVSVAVGPVLAGFIIQAFGPEIGWRASFLINFPLGLIGCVLALRWFPFGKERQRRAAKKALRETRRLARRRWAMRPTRTRRGSQACARTSAVAQRSRRPLRTSDESSRRSPRRTTGSSAHRAIHRGP